MLRMKVTAATADAANGRNVSMICQDCQSNRAQARRQSTYVIERSLEDGEESRSNQDDTNARHNPCHIHVSSPAKGEETPSKRERTNHHGVESRLRDRLAAIAIHGTGVELLIEGVRGEAYYTSKQERNEGQRGNQRAPPALVLEDDRDRRKTSIDQPVHEASVERHEKAYRVDQQQERSDKVFATDFLQRDIPFFVLGMECPIPSLVTKLSGFTKE